MLDGPLCGTRWWDAAMLLRLFFLLDEKGYWNPSPSVALALQASVDAPKEAVASRPIAPWLPTWLRRRKYIGALGAAAETGGASLSSKRREQLNWAQLQSAGSAEWAASPSSPASPSRDEGSRRAVPAARSFNRGDAGAAAALPNSPSQRARSFHTLPDVPEAGGPERPKLAELRSSSTTAGRAAGGSTSLNKGASSFNKGASSFNKGRRASAADDSDDSGSSASSGDDEEDEAAAVGSSGEKKREKKEKKSRSSSKKKKKDRREKDERSSRSPSPPRKERSATTTARGESFKKGGPQAVTESYEGDKSHRGDKADKSHRGDKGERSHRGGDNSPTRHSVPTRPSLRDSAGGGSAASPPRESGGGSPRRHGHHHGHHGHHSRQSLQSSGDDLESGGGGKAEQEASAEQLRSLALSNAKAMGNLREQSRLEDAALRDELQQICPLTEPSPEAFFTTLPPELAAAAAASKGKLDAARVWTTLLCIEYLCLQREHFLVVARRPTTRNSSQATSSSHAAPSSALSSRRLKPKRSDHQVC